MKEYTLLIREKTKSGNYTSSETLKMCYRFIILEVGESGSLKDEIENMEFPVSKATEGFEVVEVFEIMEKEGRCKKLDIEKIKKGDEEQ